jgi:serine-type D-Ala-D-Ala carboxypeptidase/endopeptidase
LARALLSGRVTLDTPVAQILPGFRSRHAAARRLHSASSRRSIPVCRRRHPISCRRIKPNPYADYCGEAEGPSREIRAEARSGAAYEYSNLGFGLLGYALAQLNHTTYRATTDEGDSQPLGMTMTGTVFTDAMRVRLAPGHLYTGEAAKNWDLDALAGWRCDPFLEQ